MKSLKRTAVVTAILLFAPVVLGSLLSTRPSNTEATTPELPWTESPGTEQPSTEQPSTEQPGTQPPGTEPPGTQPLGTEPPGTEAPLDLSTMLTQVLEEHGLIGVAAFTASSRGICAVGSSGVLARSKPDSPVNLWNSPWDAGSLVKSMTASLAALLVKDDMVPLDWETTLGDVFPEYAQDGPYVNVTLEHLLNHRGGFQYLFFGNDLEHPNLLQLATMLLLAKVDMPLMDQRRTLVQYGLTLPPVEVPGVGFQYSNMGYSIAVAMMENVTGVAWEDMITNRLFAPLNMTSAHFGCTEHSSHYSPLGHVKDPLLGLTPVASASQCDCIGALTTACNCLASPSLPIPLVSIGVVPFHYAQTVGSGGVSLQLSDWVRYYQWHLAGELGMDTSNLLSHEEFIKLHTGVDGQGPGWIITEADEYEHSTLHGRLLEHEASNLLFLSYVRMAPEMDRVYFVVTNSAETKQGEPAMQALRPILENMINITDEIESRTCVYIDTLDEGRDPGVHASCPVLVYGKEVYLGSDEDALENPMQEVGQRMFLRH